MTSTNSYHDIVKDLGKSTLEIYVTTSDFMVTNADIPTADTYCTCRKVVVRSKYDLSLIRRLVSDFDFFSFEDIKNTGTWNFNFSGENVGTFTLARE